MAKSVVWRVGGSLAAVLLAGAVPSSSAARADGGTLHAGHGRARTAGAPRQAVLDRVSAAPGAIAAAPATPATSPALASFDGIKNHGAAAPADIALAVGPDHVLQATSDRIAIFNKSGAVVAGYPKSLQDFFGLGPLAKLRHPRALYDARGGHFVLVVQHDMGTAQSSKLHVAASAGTDPRGAWRQYMIVYGGADDFGDYPTLGADKTGVYTCLNTWSNADRTVFKDAKCFLIPKSRLYAGGTLAFWQQESFTSGGIEMDTLQPATTRGTPGLELMVSSFNLNFGGGSCATGCDGLVVWGVSNPFGFLSGGADPVWSSALVDTAWGYQKPPAANAPSCVACVDTGDTRITGGVTYSAGSLLGSLTTDYLGIDNPTDVASIRWFDMNVTITSGAIAAGNLAQEGTLTYAGSGSSYYGTIVPDDANNLLMTFNYSDDNTLPSLMWATRPVGLSPNFFSDGGIFLKVGSGTVAPGTAWGGYTAAALDPLSGRIWFSGMYNHVTNGWRTRIGRAATP